MVEWRTEEDRATDVQLHDVKRSQIGDKAANVAVGGASVLRHVASRARWRDGSTVTEVSIAPE